MPDSNSATRELVRMRTGREPRELVQELYVGKRLSDREIAEYLGVDRVTVNKWRREWSIRRDDRPAAAELIA